MMTRTITLATLALAALAGAAACGDDGTSSEGGSGGTSSNSSSNASSSSSGSGGSNSGGMGGMGGSGEGGCMAGLTDCNGACVDLLMDPAHCGDCTTACSEVNASASCGDGSCVLTCDGGFDDCDMDVTTGCEANLATDPAHCGACNTVGSEVCDGADNDCNASVDNGCPSAITLANGGYGVHGQYGNLTGGNAFADTCAAGQAIYRLSGNVGGNIDRLRAHCALLILNEDQQSTPYSYNVTRGTDVTLATHGNNSTTPFDISCPPNAFVVGINGEASAGGLHDITLHCAPLTIAGPPGAMTISYGTITMVTVDGVSVGTAYSDILAAPKLVDRYRGRAGAWVDAIGIGEADVTLTLIP